MKTYDKPFKDYAVLRCTAIAVELDEAGIGKYAKDYGANPLYYENAVKYRGGNLYRAIFGFETVPDKEKELDLITELELELMKQAYHRNYYFEELKVGYEISIAGFIWPRNTPPRTNRNADKRFLRLKMGQRVLARVNLLDKPNHVDLEMPNGKVITVPFIRYMNYRRKGLLNEIKPRKPKRSAKSSKKGTTRSNLIPFRTKQEECVRPLSPKLYLVR